MEFTQAHMYANSATMVMTTSSTGQRITPSTQIIKLTTSSTVHVMAIMTHQIRLANIVNIQMIKPRSPMTAHMSSSSAKTSAATTMNNMSATITTTHKMMQKATKMMHTRNPSTPAMTSTTFAKTQNITSNTVPTPHTTANKTKAINLNGKTMTSRKPQEPSHQKSSVQLHVSEIHSSSGHHSKASVHGST